MWLVAILVCTYVTMSFSEADDDRKKGMVITDAERFWKDKIDAKVWAVAFAYTLPQLNTVGALNESFVTDSQKALGIHEDDYRKVANAARLLARLFECYYGRRTIPPCGYFDLLVKNDFIEFARCLAKYQYDGLPKYRMSYQSCQNVGGPCFYASTTKGRSVHAAECHKMGFGEVLALTRCPDGLTCSGVVFPNGATRFDYSSPWVHTGGPVLCISSSTDYSDMLGNEVVSIFKVGDNGIEDEAYVVMIRREKADEPPRKIAKSH